MVHNRIVRKVAFRDLRRFDYELVVGTVVEANFYGDGMWYLGRIVGVHPDGYFDITYEDGDRENYVEPARIRLATG